MEGRCGCGSNTDGGHGNAVAESGRRSGLLQVGNNGGSEVRKLAHAGHEARRMGFGY